MVDRPGNLHYVRDVSLARDLRCVSAPSLTTSSGQVDIHRSTFFFLELRIDVTEVVIGLMVRVC
jgi:hypothetical protein